MAAKRNLEVKFSSTLSSSVGVDILMVKDQNKLITLKKLKTYISQYSKLNYTQNLYLITIKMIVIANRVARFKPPQTL